MSDDDRTLLDRYGRDRDVSAFDELVRRYGGWVYGACLRACGDRQVAEDAAQECFLELARQAHRVRTSLPGWLHTVARRIARRLRPRAHAPLDDAVTADAGGGEAAALLRELDEALEAMPDELRAILIARCARS